MSEERNWRDAKMPQWVKESIAAEMKASELTAALSWPTEIKPQPVFWGTGYGQVGGSPESGDFYMPIGGGDCQAVTVKCTTYSVKIVAERGSESITQFQSFFRTEHDARLFALWERCENAAKDLAKMRSAMK